MRILVVEDNERLAANTAEYLRTENFTVDISHNGDEALEMASMYDYDLLLLDIDLPGSVSGLDICRFLRERQKNTPIIMLTAHDTTADKVEGLDMGADDYLTKPFAFDELLARVRVQLRSGSEAKSNTIELAPGITLDTRRKEVVKNKQKISITPKEYAILHYLARNKGIFRNRQDILDHVWGSAGENLELFSDTIEVHIANLRRKIDKNIIKTYRGHGYIIE